MSHPRYALDSLIHRPITLSILAALDAVDEADFATVRETVVVSDPTLSKQISALESVGYVTVRKRFIGRRRRTYLAVTTLGRNALREHLRTLWVIARDIDISDTEG